jgi:hypothetical protein
MTLQTVSLANALSGLLTPIVVGAIAWYFVGSRQGFNPPDMAARRRRFWLAWEIRGLVLVAAGPCAAGIYFGRLSPDYTTPLLLFMAAGFLAAGLIAPSGLHVHR